MNKKRCLACIISIILTLAIALSILLPSQVARADSIITVTTTIDRENFPDDCTLRDAITAADKDTPVGGCPAGSGPDTIILASGVTYILTIDELSIHTKIIIEGNGSTIERSSADGITDFRIFWLTANENYTGDLTLNNLTLSNGVDLGGGGGIRNYQGTLTLNQSTVSGNSNTGIVNQYGASLYINNSTISGNSGGGISNNQGNVYISNSTIHDNYENLYGGGITNYFGEVYVYNSTVSGNSATEEGGGIRNKGGLLRLTNSTVSGNSVSDDGVGGGIYDYDGEVELTNTIIAKQLSGIDCYGDSVTSFGYNLDSDRTCNLDGIGDISNADPNLGSLQDNGGPTWTHALLEGSPALDVVPTGECQQDTDQRGIERPQGIACDMGAFELEQMKVDIEIKPGSDAKCINDDGSGVIPVAIFGSTDMNVRIIDPKSVELEGLTVATKGNSNKLLAAYEDLNQDGYMDLVIKFEKVEGSFTPGSSTAVLTGTLRDGSHIFGVDDICLVP